MPFVRRGRDQQEPIVRSEPGEPFSFWSALWSFSVPECRPCEGLDFGRIGATSQFALRRRTRLSWIRPLTRQLPPRSHSWSLSLRGRDRSRATVTPTATEATHFRASSCGGQSRTAWTGHWLSGGRLSPIPAPVRTTPRLSRRFGVLDAPCTFYTFRPSVQKTDSGSFGAGDSATRPHTPHGPLAHLPTCTRRSPAWSAGRGGFAPSPEQPACAGRPDHSPG